MQRYARTGSALAIVIVLATSASALTAQELPLASSKGKAVSPAFEGWYQNKDGTYSISFGYYNQNSDEVIDIPIPA